MASQDSCTIERLQSLNRSVCAEFVDATYACLYRWFHWLTRDPDQASELTQSTFLAFWDTLSAADGSADARLWLFAVGRNVWRNSCRQLHRDRQRINPKTDVATLHRETDSSSAAGAAIANERTADVRRAVVQLKPDLREAVTLRYWQGCSYKEIARVLAISPELARQRVFQGRKQLSVQLSSWWPLQPNSGV